MDASIDTPSIISNHITPPFMEPSVCETTHCTQVMEPPYKCNHVRILQFSTLFIASNKLFFCLLQITKRLPAIIYLTKTTYQRRRDGRYLLKYL